MRTAVRTRALTPLASRAELRARELITVASIPIWSPLIRSKPRPAPLSPRKMLPPPITIPTWMPIRVISAICSAYSDRRWSSMPCCLFPISDSPLSLRSILLNFITDIFFEGYFLGYTDRECVSLLR